MGNKQKIMNKHMRIIIFFLLLSVHVILLNKVFPFDSIINDKIITTEDYPFKLAVSLYIKDLVINEHKLIFFPSELLTPYLVTLFSFIDSNLVFKIIVFLFQVFIPVVLYFTILNFSKNKRFPLLGMALAIIILHFDFPVKSLMRIGIYALILSQSVALLAFSFLCKGSIKKNIFKVLGFLFLAILIHKSAIILFSICLFWFVFFNYSVLKKYFNSSLKAKVIVLLLLFISLFFMLNTFFKLSSFVQSSNFDEDYSNGFSTIVTEMGRFPIKTSIHVFGIYSLLVLLINKKSKKNFLLAGIAMTLFLIGYFGSFSHFLSYLKPRRLSNSLTFFYLIPITLLFERKTKQKLVTIILLILLANYLIPLRWPIIGTWDNEITTQDILPTTSKLLDWIENNIPVSETILLEASHSGRDGNWTNAHIYGGHMPALFHQITNNSFDTKCDNIHELKINNYSICISEGMFDGRDILQSESDLKDKLMRLNYDWIVVWSNVTRKKFLNISFVTEIKNIDYLTIYKINYTNNKTQRVE